MTKPILYRSYQRVEIEMLLKASPVIVADGFIVASKLLICLANTTGPERTFTFTKPSEMIWSPKTGTPEAVAMLTCRLPDPLEKAFSSRAYQRLVFVKEGGINYQYVGEIGLSFVGIRPPVGRIASFYLTPKLSRPAWSRFGNYSHWQLTVNSRTQSLSEATDLEVALSPEWEADIVDVFLTRYEEDYMHVVVNGDSAVVMYGDEVRGIGMLSRNSNYSGRPRAMIHLTGFDHADWDTAARNVICKSDALELLKAFFRTGEAQGLDSLK